jgi:hypothetical protein
MIERVEWECDYSNPEKTSFFSSDERYEWVTKKYYKKCYYYINGSKKGTSYKYHYKTENVPRIDHFSYSYTDTKEEKTGRYKWQDHYKYFLWFDFDHNVTYSYEYKKYERTVTVLDNGKKIYGNWDYVKSYYK